MTKHHKQAALSQPLFPTHTYCASEFPFCIKNFIATNPDHQLLKAALASSPHNSAPESSTYTPLKKIYEGDIIRGEDRSLFLERTFPNGVHQLIMVVLDGVGGIYSPMNQLGTELFLVALYQELLASESEIKSPTDLVSLFLKTYDLWQKKCKDYFGTPQEVAVSFTVNLNAIVGNKLFSFAVGDSQTLVFHDHQLIFKSPNPPVLAARRQFPPPPAAIDYPPQHFVKSHRQIPIEIQTLFDEDLFLTPSKQLRPTNQDQAHQWLITTLTQELQLPPGATILCTSDGVTDNLFDHDLVDQTNKNPSATEIAVLAFRATQSAKNTPYLEAAKQFKELSPTQTGDTSYYDRMVSNNFFAKPDDITCLRYSALL